MSSEQHTRMHEPSKDVVARARISSMEAYHALCQEAEADYEGYWARHARELLEWRTPFEQVLDESKAPFYTWFADGRLNASYNCLDRHVLAGKGDKTALIFEADDGTVARVTYKQLLVQVCKLANALRGMGVKKGDRVVIYMPMGVEGVAAMQACARIGAVHSVVFGGFSAHALRDRIHDTEAVVLLTSDGQFRGGRTLPLKSIADEALMTDEAASVRKVIVLERTGMDVNMTAGRDVWYHELISDQSEVCEPEWVEAEHPLFILYTSGSTGKPKGVQHATGGYLLQAAMSMRYTFDIQPDDIFWCTADIGWVTGHTFVTYGPLACGATQIVFEGVPTHPDAGRFWRMIEKHKVTIFYTAPTAIRSLIKAADNTPDIHPDTFDLTSLRLLGSVGEPINPAAWEWYHKHVGGGRCPVIDTFWQTETGAHVITPLPATPLVPGSCTLPFPGIQAAIIDESGAELPHGQPGMLAFTRPWPAMIRNVWGDSERFKKTYFPPELRDGTLYLAGDGAVRDKDTGYFTITGRIDDVINVSGHRMGTMEIESALVAHENVAEAAVVSKPDDVTGEKIVAFVVLKGERPGEDSADTMVKTLQDWVGTEIGPIAKPRDIRFGENLPKTRSGKIMRRLLRQLAKGEEITQDTSTLENPAILEQLKTEE